MNLKFDQDMKIVFKKRSAKTFSSSVRVQAILDFRSFDFRNFRFKAVYNSILFSSPLVRKATLIYTVFAFYGLFVCPHINSVNRKMPAVSNVLWLGHLLLFDAVQQLAQQSCGAS